MCAVCVCGERLDGKEGYEGPYSVRGSLKHICLYSSIMSFCFQLRIVHFLVLDIHLFLVNMFAFQERN